MKKIPCEYRTDEGYRLFKDGACGTIRTIKCGGYKRVIEIYDKSDNILIKQATKKGYIECENGGVADLSYPSSKNTQRKSSRAWHYLPHYYSNRNRSEENR